MDMRYWLGAGLLTFAAALTAAAFRRRRQALAAPSSEALSPSLGMLAEVVRPLVLLGLAYLGLKTVAIYFWVGGVRYLSLFDLGAMLVLMAAFGHWLVVRTRYRPAREGARPETDTPVVDLSLARGADSPSRAPAAPRSRSGRRSAA